MASKYSFSSEEIAAIKVARRVNKGKRAEARLKALELHAEGMKSNQFPEDTILLCCDGAAWHKSRALEPPDNIVIFRIPPYIPEMNPIEQIRKEIRKRSFRNEVFTTLEKVIDRLCDTICPLTTDTIFSITARHWIIKMFN